MCYHIWCYIYFLIILFNSYAVSLLQVMQLTQKPTKRNLDKTIIKNLYQIPYLSVDTKWEKQLHQEREPNQTCGESGDQLFPIYVATTLVSNKQTSKQTLIWAVSWQNQQNECASSEDSDQPGHPPSLFRGFAVRLKKAWVLSYLLSAQRRLVRLGDCPGWSESSLGAQSYCWLCHEAAHFTSKHKSRHNKQLHNTTALERSIIDSQYISRNFHDNLLLIPCRSTMSSAMMHIHSSTTRTHPRISTCRLCKYFRIWARKLKYKIKIKMQKYIKITQI